MKPKGPTYKDLNLDGNFYCLVWLGEITKGHDTDVLDIEVKFIDLGIKVDKKTTYKVHRFKAENTISRTINIRHLPDLTIGSLWKNNELCKKSSKINPILTFNLHTTNDIELGICDVLFKHDVLENFMYLHHNKAKYLKINNTGFAIQNSSEQVDVLLIPCIEIFRFYYSSSATMIDNVITGRIGDGDMYIKEASTNDNGDVKIKLGPKLGETDAFLCGLLLYDEYAKRATIHTSNKYLTELKNSEHSNSNTGRYIEAKIPFENDVTLSVAGRFIRTASGKRVFLVYEITMHSSYYPFLSIGYWPFHDNSQVPESDPKLVPGRNIKGHDPNKEGGITGNPPGAPGSRIRPISTYYQNKYSSNFPTPYRAKKLEQKTKSTSTSIDKSDKPVDDETVREPTSKNSKSGRGSLKKGNSNKGEKDTDTNTYDREKVLQDFKTLSQQIAQRNNLQHTFRGNLDATNDIDYVHVEFSTKSVSKKVRNWCKRERKGREWIKPRHLVISEFETSKNQFFYMIEIQRRTDLKESYPIIYFHSLDYQKISYNHLKATVDRIRNQMGKVKIKEYNLLKIKLIKHQTNLDFMVRLIEKVMSESKLT